MKNKFLKNLFQLMCYIIAVSFVYAMIITVALIENVKEDAMSIIILSYIIPSILSLSLGFYWIFQRVIIDETGVTVKIINKIIKHALWNEVESIEEDSFMRNPAYNIKIKDGSEIHLDKRKQIKNAIEFYSGKQIKK